MQLVSRYVLVEILRVFVIALCVITVVFFFHGLVTDFLLQGLGPRQIVKLMPYLMPGALRNAIHGAILLAVCSVYGRMAADNELLAANSLGISSMAIVRPALVLTVGLALFCVWLNDVRAWWGYNGIQRVVLESADEIAYQMLRSNRSYTTERFAIHVQGVDGQTLIRPTITYWPRGDSPTVTISAEAGLLRSNPQEGTLSVVVRNGTAYAGSELTVAFSDTFEQVVPLAEASRDESFWPAENQPMRLIPAEIRRQKLEVARLTEVVRQLESGGKVQGGMPTLGGASGDGAATRSAAHELRGHGTPVEPAAPSAGGTPSPQEILHATQRQKLALGKRRLATLQTMPHKRWASGCCCIGFVMLGIPVAVRLRSADFLTSFFMCFLPIVLFYQPMQFFGIDLAQAGRVPPWSPWLGTVVLVLAGAWLMRTTFATPSFAWKRGA